MLSKIRVMLAAALAVAAAAPAFSFARTTAPAPAALRPGLDFIHVCTDAGAGGYEAFPDVCRLSDGRLMCVFYAGHDHVSFATADHPKGGRISFCVSNDEGLTWSAPRLLFDGPDDDRDPSIVQLPSGRLLCNFFILRRKEGPTQPAWDGLGTWLVESDDLGRTWSAPRRISADYYCSSPVRVLPDGRLMLGLYREEQGRAWGAVTSSADGGRTWGPTVDIPNGGWKLDAETDIVRLADGTLLAAEREKATSMCYSRSKDGGRTWSVSAPLGFPGHCPYFLKTRRGVLLLAHRLPQTSLHWSLDDGRTWSANVLVDDLIGAYPSMVELRDGSILIVYYEEGAGSSIRARRFSIDAGGVKWLTFGSGTAGAPGGGAAGKAAPAPDLDARFHSTESWLGADGIYSVTLSDRRTAWLFSDTWIGVIRGGRRAEPRMINNSAGITEGGGPARFYYAGVDGREKALFAPPDGRGWFWPWAAVLDGGRLWLFATRVERAEGSGAFGFAHFGTALGEVENPGDAPTAWRVRWRDVPAAWAPRVFWGSAALAAGGYVYVYGFLENGKKGLDFRRGMLAARAPSGRLGDFSAWRFFDGNAWQEDIRTAAEICADVATEYSVTRLPGRGRFLLVTHDAFLSPKIVARTAANPWGPWSDKIELYTCPEADAKRGVFCYAAKHQPVYSDEKTIVVSYATNADDMNTVLDNPSLYVPRFIRLPLGAIPD
ncbi:MAG: exo-alpha-sialidase [Acidobacteriota bacterium]